MTDSRLETFATDNLAKTSFWNRGEHVDWTDIWQRHSVNVIMPNITTDILGDHFSDYESNMTLEDATERFMNTSAYDEWLDGYYPATYWSYKIELPGNHRDLEEIATELANEVGCVSLVQVGDDYYLALSGGGMDLSWEIAAAFIICGLIPPLVILDQLPCMSSDNKKFNSPLGATFSQLVMDCVYQGTFLLDMRKDALNRTLEVLTK